jgi:hypothetical protein
MSSLKQELLDTIAAAPEEAIAPTLQFLKTLLQTPSSPRPASGRSLLRHAGTWQGEDFEECIQSVYDSRSEAKF